MKRITLFILLVLAVPAAAPSARADSITDIASILRADSPVPFRYGVAGDLATNLWDAQAAVAYGGPVSLELSIEAVIRAIGIDNTRWVGWASTDPITWLQSDIAIDPGASIGITPSALYFGEVNVATPESPMWMLIIAILVLVGAWCGWKWLRKPTPPPPVIPTDYGPVTEWARYQGAINMRLDPDKKREVEESLATKHGSVAVGLAEARRMFPEAYED